MAKHQRDPKKCIIYGFFLLIIGLILCYVKMSNMQPHSDIFKGTGLVCILLASLSIFCGLCFWVCDGSKYETQVDTIHVINVDQQMTPPPEIRIDYSQDLPPNYEDVIKYDDHIPASNYNETIQEHYYEQPSQYEYMPADDTRNNDPNSDRLPKVKQSWLYFMK